MAFHSVMGPVLMGKKVQKQRENSGGMVGEVSGFFKNALPDTFELVKAQGRIRRNMQPRGTILLYNAAEKFVWGKAARVP